LNYISISTLFYRDDFIRAGGFDESMLAFEDWDLFIKILKNGGEAVELPIAGLNYRRKDQSLFREAVKDSKRTFKDLLKLYNNNIDIYEKYFDSPIKLIQENEKMKKVIYAYRQTKTYKVGLSINRIKNTFKPNN